MLPEIGIEGQQKLSTSKVLIVGVGGLGCPIALYLTAAGVGHIGLIDADIVSLSNLQRQILYTSCDVGKYKVECAKSHLSAMSPHTTIDAYNFNLNPNNGEEIIAQYDVIVDACDNAATRYLMDDVCARLGKPYVYGAISEYSGQISVFAHNQKFRYNNLFPTKHNPEQSKEVVSGVIGALPGIVGSIQAAEVIKLITGMGEPLLGKLFHIDIRTMHSFVIDLQ